MLSTCVVLLYVSGVDGRCIWVRRRLVISEAVEPYDRLELISQEFLVCAVLLLSGCLGSVPWAG